MLGQRKATTLQPGELADAVDLDSTRTGLAKKTRSRLLDRLPLLPPDVSAGLLGFRSHPHKYDDLSKLPTPALFYGLQIGEEIEVEIDPGKTLIVKLISIGEPDTAGGRALFYEINGMPREAIIRDAALAPRNLDTRPKGEPTNPAHACAPMPGVVSEVVAKVGMEVKQGDKLVTLEAMKMLTSASAGIDGIIKEVQVKKGDQVESEDLLVKIEATA